MNAFKVIAVPASNSEYVVGVAGHQVAFQYLWDRDYRGLECIEGRFVLARQDHLDEKAHAKAEECLIELSSIGLDDPRLLQQLDAAMACRRRQTDELAEFRDAPLAILTERQ